MWSSYILTLSFEQYRKLPFVHQVWTVSFVNICCFSQFKGRRCFSLVIAEQLIDGKGTHRDEGDINAGKRISLPEDARILLTWCPCGGNSCCSPSPSWTSSQPAQIHYRCLYKYSIFFWTNTLLLPAQISHIFLRKYIIVCQISTFGFGGNLITWAIL